MEANKEWFDLDHQAGPTSTVRRACPPGRAVVMVKWRPFPQKKKRLLGRHPQCHADNPSSAHPQERARIRGWVGRRSLGGEKKRAWRGERLGQSFCRLRGTAIPRKNFSKPRPATTRSIRTSTLISGGELLLAARPEPIAQYLCPLPAISSSLSSALFPTPWDLPGHHDALVGHRGPSQENMLPFTINCL